MFLVRRALMQLILKQWPASVVTDTDINLKDLRGAILRNISDVIAQTTLKSIHNKYWLLCDCNKTNPSALTVRRLNQNHYCLVNIQGKGEHTEECPLRYTSFECDKSVKQSTGRKFSFPTNAVHESSIYNSDNTHELIPTIKRLKHYLITHSRLNCIEPNKTFRSNLDALDETVNGNVYVNNSLLKDRFYFGYRNFFHAKERIVKELESSAQSSPLFLFDIVDTVERGKNFLKFTKHYKNMKPFSFKLFNHLSSVSCDTELEGPYIIVSQMGELQNKNGRSVIAPLATVIEPIANKQLWSDVSSPIMRAAINKLQSTVDWYKSKLDLPITVNIHRTPISTDLGTCHPLFTVKLGQVEAVFDLQIDLSLKQETQKSLEYIIASTIGGGGYCVLRSDMSEGKINEVLFRAITAIMKELKRTSEGARVFEGSVIRLY